LGYSISWCSLRASKESALRALGFKETDEVDQANEAPFSAAYLPSGWSIVWANDVDFASPGNLERLHLPTPVIACQIEEHSMYSACHEVNDGLLSWSVWHDAQVDVYDLNSFGNVPQEFEAIAAAQRAEQEANGGTEAGVDYIFDAPVELAMALTSYRHDRWRFDWGEPRFTAIKRRHRPRLGLFRR